MDGDAGAMTLKTSLVQRNWRFPWNTMLLILLISLIIHRKIHDSFIQIASTSFESRKRSPPQVATPTPENPSRTSFSLIQKKNYLEV